MSLELASLKPDLNLCAFCGTVIPYTPQVDRADGGCSRCGWGEWFHVESSGGELILKSSRGILRIEDLDRLITITAEKPGMNLVFDLARVTYMASTALGKLITLKTRVEGAKGKFRLSNPSAEILEVFRITGLEKVFRWKK